MIEISIIELVFYTFGTFMFGAAIGAAMATATPIAYFKKEMK